MKQGFGFGLMLFVLMPAAFAQNTYHSLYEHGVTTSSFQTGKVTSSQLRWLLNLGVGADFSEEYRVNFMVGYSPVFSGEVDGRAGSANDFLFTLDGSYLMQRESRTMFVGAQVQGVLSDVHTDISGSQRDWNPDFGALLGVEYELNSSASAGVRADVLMWRGFAGQLSTYLLYRY